MRRRRPSICERQASLPGIEAPPEFPAGAQRLFLALLPDAPAAAQIGQLQDRLIEQHALTGKRFPPWRLHVTLHFVGDFAQISAPLLEPIASAAASIETRAFTSVFDRALSFTTAAATAPLVLVASDGAPQCAALHRALKAALADRGLRSLQPEAGANPHLTLLYDRRRVAACALSPIAWPVREFCLVHHALGSREPYALLARWPLRD